MKSSCLAAIVLCAVLASADDSVGFGHDLITGVLKTMESNRKALENDLKSLSTQVSNLTIKVEQFMSEQLKLAEKIDHLMDVIVDECPKSPKRGVYQLRPSGQLSTTFPVYCEEGWIVMQRRINGCLSFNRKWNEYRDGFGDVRGEYWLGLEKIHQITREGSYELMVVFKSIGGVEKRAKYGWFKIAGETEQYRLNLGDFREGDVRDSLTSHNGTQFSTPDRDNDNNVDKDCAKLFGSGWWFTDNCYYSNLNGESNGPYSKIEWYNDYQKYEGLNEARMMIRAIT